ncbi:MAG: GNAT family N-acetyltransferase [Pseudomonadota bacterium]
MSVHLRAFADADAPVINRLAVLAFSQYSDKYNDWPALAKVMERMSDMAATAEIVIAEHAGRVIGAVGYLPPFGAKAAHFKPEWPIVRMLVVDPQARGLGAGRALTEACIDRARRDRAPEIALHTSEMMTVALPMYLRMGFVRVSDAPPLFGVPYGIYVKRLGGAE